jgi:hypothetical protein
MRPFRLTEYRCPESGETPTVALANALISLPRGNDAIRLIHMAAFRNHLAREGQLRGQCLAKFGLLEIQIWLYSRGPFHMVYSFCKARNEVCLLRFFSGPFKKAELEDEARKRVLMFYGT